MGDMVMEVNLKDYETAIKSMVWKFRNLGFVDMLYAPVVDSSVSGRAESKMAGIEEGSTKKKKFRFMVSNFEDLLSEAYLVFTEIKSKIEAMEYICKDCQTQCPHYISMMNCNFEQILISALQQHFTDLHKGILREKRTASIKQIGEHEETTIPISDGFLAKLARDYRAGCLEPIEHDIADGIFTGKLTNLTKESITKYLQEKGHLRKEIRQVLYKKIV
jgi:hypothetical protein